MQDLKFHTNLINMKDIKFKLRTVSVNERGQVVIPEDVRKDFGIENKSTLVLIERKNEIVLKRESDILETIENEDRFWANLSKHSMKRAWSKEDAVWDEIYSKTKYSEANK